MEKDWYQNFYLEQSRPRGLPDAFILGENLSRKIKSFNIR